MSDEILDIYDLNRNKTGTGRRGQPLLRGEFRAVVDVWVRNGAGLYLISKRAPNISAGGQWQCTCGSVISGEQSLRAAVREANEELGLVLEPENGRFLFEIRRVHENGGGMFFDVWFFKHNIDIENIVLQEGETVAAKWASSGEILSMHKSGVFVKGIDYLEKLFAMIEK